MNNFSQYLIEFMQAKHDYIKTNTGYDFYFNDKDKDFIKMWGKEISEMIWDDIFNSVYADFSPAYGLEARVCPFCLYQGEIKSYDTLCSGCVYAKHGHGICDKSDSHFHMIRTKLKGHFRYANDLPHNTFYRKAIQDILKVYE